MLQADTPVAGICREKAQRDTSVARSVHRVALRDRPIFIVRERHEQLPAHEHAGIRVDIKIRRVRDVVATLLEKPHQT
jgi:hypothetical protein